MRFCVVLVLTALVSGGLAGAFTLSQREAPLECAPPVTTATDSAVCPTQSAPLMTATECPQCPTCGPLPVPNHEPPAVRKQRRTVVVASTESGGSSPECVQIAARLATYDAEALCGKGRAGCTVLRREGSWPAPFASHLGRDRSQCEKFTIQTEEPP
jgi:hypothetical protein